MDNIGRRIGTIIESLDIKKVQFADRIKVDQSYISQLVSGKRNPSDRTIADICREFNVSEVWLRTGEGEMFVDLGEDAELTQVLAEIQVSDDDTIKDVLVAYWELEEKEKAAIRKLIDGHCQTAKRKSRAAKPPG